MVLPLVRVRAPKRFMSSPEHNVMFPSVVVMAATAFKFRVRPALNKTLPLVVVMAAFTLISRPQHAEKFPLTAVIAAFTLMSRKAFKLRVVVLGVAVQLTASFMKMSPLTPVDPCRVVVGGVPATVASDPAVVVMVTLFVTSSAESVAPEMLPPVALTVKSKGSKRKVPVFPLAAAGGFF